MHMALLLTSIDTEQPCRFFQSGLNGIFGFHSSAFDFITLYLLYGYFHLSGAPFQTRWFLQSVLTEVLILFYGAHPPPFTAQPSRQMAVDHGTTGHGTDRVPAVFSFCRPAGIHRAECAGAAGHHSRIGAVPAESRWAKDPFLEVDRS